MKYVIELIQKGSLARLRIHVFSEDVSHDEFPKHPDGKAVGAGFCHIVSGRVATCGKSVSLKLGPHPQDANTLAQFFAGTFEQVRILIAENYL